MVSLKIKTKKNTTEELIQNQEKILCKSQAMGLPFLRTHSPADCVLGGEKTLVTYRHSPKGRDVASYTRCSPTAWALLCSHPSLHTEHLLPAQ